METEDNIDVHFEDAVAEVSGVTSDFLNKRLCVEYHCMQGTRV